MFNTLSFIIKPRRRKLATFTRRVSCWRPSTAEISPTAWQACASCREWAPRWHTSAWNSVGGASLVLVRQGILCCYPAFICRVVYQSFIYYLLNTNILICNAYNWRTTSKHWQLPKKLMTSGARLMTHYHCMCYSVSCLAIYLRNVYLTPLKISTRVCRYEFSTCVKVCIPRPDSLLTLPGRSSHLWSQLGLAPLIFL